MDCFGTYFTHAQACNVTRVQSATQWTASVHTFTHVQTCNVTRVQSATEWTCFGTYFTHAQTCNVTRVSKCYAMELLRYNLRRMNNVGRFVASSRKKTSPGASSCKAASAVPGLFEVLTALKEYRVACSEGYAKVSPSNAFQPDALDWLEPQEENASWNPKKNLTPHSKGKNSSKRCTVGSANVPVWA